MYTEFKKQLHLSLNYNVVVQSCLSTECAFNLSISQLSLVYTIQTGY